MKFLVDNDKLSLYYKKVPNFDPFAQISHMELDEFDRSFREMDEQIDSELRARELIRQSSMVSVQPQNIQRHGQGLQREQPLHLNHVRGHGRGFVEQLPNREAIGGGHGRRHFGQPLARGQNRERVYRKFADHDDFEDALEEDHEGDGELECDIELGHSIWNATETSESSDEVTLVSLVPPGVTGLKKDLIDIRASNKQLEKYFTDLCFDGSSSSRSIETPWFLPPVPPEIPLTATARIPMTDSTDFPTNPLMIRWIIPPYPPDSLHFRSIDSTLNNSPDSSPDPVTIWWILPPFPPDSSTRESQPNRAILLTICFRFFFTVQSTK